MSRAVTSLRLGLALVGLVAVGCGGGSSGTGSSNDTAGIAFHGEAPVLPDFSFDTGLQPPSSPAQMSMKLTSGGSIKVDTAAARAGGKLQGTAGGGKVSLDMHVKLEGHLKVDLGPEKYDGDLPGLKDVDVPIAGSAAFDGFLVDGKTADISTDVPETKLPDIPLGAVPGTLQLTVGAGSNVTTSFHGDCISVKGGQATFTGETTTAGTLVLKASIMLDIPLYSKTIDLPSITIPIPSSVKPITFAAVAVPGVADGNDGKCGAASAADPGAMGAAGAADGGAPMTTPPPSSGGGMGAVDSGTSSSSDTTDAGGLSVCSNLTNDAPTVAFEVVAGAMPASTGGALVTGTYFLTALRGYDGAAAGNYSVKRELVIHAGGAIEEISTSAGITETASGTIALAGSQIVRSFGCPAGTPDDTPGFSANDTTMTLSFPTDNVSFTYSRQ